MSKSVQISTRLTDQDALFLADLQIAGAQTPSDKVRALIEEARRRSDGSHDYKTSLAWLRDVVAPALDRVRTAELEHGTHSELVFVLVEWAAEVLACALAHAPSEGAGPDALLRLERLLADRAFRGVDAVLRLAVTRRAPCYDRDVLRARAGELAELAALVTRGAQGPKGDSDG
jgi:hypothetical protein